MFIIIAVGVALGAVVVRAWSKRQRDIETEAPGERQNKRLSEATQRID